MKVSFKLIVIMVCAMISMSFVSLLSEAKGAGKKPPKDAKMTVKDANVPAESTKAAEPAAEKAVIKEQAPKPAEPTLPKPPPPKAVAPSAAVPVDSTEPAVTVNGTVITEGQVDAKVKPMLERRMSQMDPNMAEQLKKRSRAQMLDRMITEQLLDEQVAKANITVSDSDVNDKISEILKQQNLSIDTFKALLAAQGQSYEQVQQQIKKSVGYEKVFEKQSGAVEVNDAEALAFYEENKAGFSTPEELGASHILIKVAPSATPEEKAAAKEKAEKLLKEIKADANFAELAKANSDCPSKEVGGDLGTFPRGRMVKEFEDAAFGMKVGQVSDVVETQFGYHIIKVTSRKDAGVTPFEEAKTEIVARLKQGKLGRLSKEYIDKLKAEAKIVYPAGKEPAPIMPMRMEMAPPAPAPK